MKNINAIIRPAARHILTIGKGLIKDTSTAIVELVKNSYDADATEVIIIFEKIIGEEKLKISIQDDGCGMSSQTVLEKWLVPSTDNKVKNSKSKNGRREVQGKKGIGRYASSILGESILMQTIDEDTQEQTEVYIEWKEFENDKYVYLDEVPILLEISQASKYKKGTLLEITSEKQWTDEDLNNMEVELRRLVLPFEKEAQDRFIIKLNRFGKETTLEAYPLFEHYHYRIAGTMKPITKNDKLAISLIANYENNYELDSLIIIPKELVFNLKNGECFGEIQFDIKVCDLGKEDKENLNRRAIDRDLVKEWEYFRGVSLFREGFRIRPYGDKRFDWLGLDMRRVDSPTKKISNNQILAVVSVENENISHLEEKASREGLKENSAYSGLIESIVQAINLLEQERYIFKKARKEQYKEKTEIEEELPKIGDLSELSTTLKQTLTVAGVDKKTVQAVVVLIQQAQITKEKQIIEVQKIITEKTEEQKEVIAMFQTQATLGKILTQVFHESRNYLHHIRINLPILLQWNKNIESRVFKTLNLRDNIINETILKIEKKLKIMDNGLDAIDVMFRKLNPMTITKRKPKKNILLKPFINNVFSIFEIQIKESNIVVTINIPENLSIFIWEDDLMTICINLIDNSIYWLNEADKPEKNIYFNVYKDQQNIIMDFIDNGIGLSQEDVIKGAIFELGYSKKPNGTGIGLYMVGDAIRRNKGLFKAIFDHKATHFCLIFNQ